MRVKCKIGQAASLTESAEYTVLEQCDGYHRVINNRGEPALYAVANFDSSDSTTPNNWVRELYEDDEWFCGPPEFLEAGFFEDVFDGMPEAIDVLLSVAVVQPEERRRLEDWVFAVKAKGG